ncbi:hypothetical protein [Bradyrhizobium sp. I71]|uniref:hypothetical protein n=1 Tax=Bradyrhizobium sp. I71 TaxID=2590772 RepID=UPI001EF7750B|nr:hypothetical protein [Bradyrhizobium sp. I71]ULK95962.1 hypothetical protein FJV43_24790 [Bradyrhizobium sp. I71]
MEQELRRKPIKTSGFTIPNAGALTSFVMSLFYAAALRLRRIELDRVNGQS